MKVGPKFKIARRLGAPVFEKTQTQKFSLGEPKRGRAPGRGGPRSDYGKQMLEKQKARYYYLLSEKQFSNYVKAALAKKDAKSVPSLYEALESRLDNAVLRMGFAQTRPFARQMVSHGHVLVNGKRVTIPSFKLSEGDVVSIRKESQNKAMFAGLDERQKNVTVPSWIKFDYDKKVGAIQGKPNVQNADLLFDLNAVFEFYSR